MPVSQDDAENGVLLHSASESDQSVASATSHVRFLVNDLESRYSPGTSLPTQPPPSLQSCPKIAALQDSLISKVQDPGISRTSSSPMPENLPKVTTVRDQLVSKAQAPEATKISAPVLQSCPRIMALRETLISRVQGSPQTSRTLDRDLADCPSVAARQIALLDVATRSPLQRRSTITASFPPPKNVPFNHQDAPDSGLPNSLDKPEADSLRVGPSNCEDGLTDRLSGGGEELADVPSDDRIGPKWEEAEYCLTNLREVPEDERVNHSDGPDCGLNLEEGESLNSTEKLGKRLYGEGCGYVPDTVPSNHRDVPVDISGPDSSSNSVLSTSVLSDSMTAETLPQTIDINLSQTL